MKQQNKKTGRGKIMVVDNDKDITRLIEKVLGKTGNYDVLSVNESTQAIKLARENLPDLILLDVLMPEMHGPEIALQLSYDERLKHIPIIFITSLLEKSDTESSGKKIGGHMCLAKPFRPEDLVACLRKSAVAPVAH